MGIVYVAEDLRVDGRKVALKRIKRKGNDEQLAVQREQLNQEGLKLARVADHPNVVDLFDIVHDDKHNETLLVLEYIDGEDLASWQASERPWRELVRQYLGAAAGVAAAHQKGLTHCDFKASNVVISKLGIPHVIDFGIATPIDDSREDPGSDEDGPAGSPFHMAPERYRGIDSDPRSDQFSWGVALWHGLTGEYPFEKAEESTSLERAIADGPRGTVSPLWLRRVLMQAMSANPWDRYPDMDALVSAIERGLKRRIYLLIASVFGCVLVLGGLIGWILNRAPQPLFESCEGFLAHSERVETQLAELGRAPTSTQNHQLVVRRVEAALGQWREDVLDHCDARDHLQRDSQVECMEQWIETFGEGLEHLIADGVLDTDMPEYLERMLPVGGAYCVVPPQLDAGAWRYAELARASAHDGRLGLARGYLERAMRVAEPFGKFSAEKAEALDAHAQVLVRHGNDALLDEAVTFMSEARLQALGSSYVGGQYSCALRLAKLYTMFDAPRVELARAALAEAEAVANSLELERGSLMWAELEDARGLVLAAEDQHEAAANAHRAAADSFIELGRPVGAAKAQVNLGSALWALEDYEEARQAYREALEWLHDYGVPPTHDTLLRAHFGLGVIAVAEKAAWGVANLEHVVRHGPERKRVETLALLTQLFVERDELDRALDPARQCVEALATVDDQDQAFMWGMMCSLALIYAGEPEGEDMLVALLRAHAERPAYYDGMRSWIQYLIMDERCDEARAAVVELDASPAALEQGASYKKWRADELEACD